MIEAIVSKINNIWNSLLHSKFYFIWLPLFIWFLWFLETVGIFGFFIPMEIVSITYFAFIYHKLWLFLFASLIFGISVFGWLLVWYFIWRKFYKKIIWKLEEKFPALKEYFEDVETKIEKYHILAFPLLINIWFTRPIMAMHLGARHYNFWKFLIWSIIATISYVIPRVFIWYLVWVFWKAILEKLEIWFKYVLYFAIGVVVLAFIVDIIKEEKDLKK